MKRKNLLLCGLLLTACNAWGQQVIAHRGFWNSEGAAMNSVAAMEAAHKAGAWGSEFDVHITRDSVVVVNHDDDIHGILIEEAVYDDIKDLRLANGERIPTLRQYLEAGKALGTMRLVLEIKEHATAEREDRCVAACLKEVGTLGLEDRVDYISFSLHACEEVIKQNPKARVYYLNGELPPREILLRGFSGIDYSGEVVLQHPEWIAECHELGMKVNVWTIDEVKQIQLCKQAGVDFVTTNKPVEALKIAAGELTY